MKTWQGNRQQQKILRFCKISNEYKIVWSQTLFAAMSKLNELKCRKIIWSIDSDIQTNNRMSKECERERKAFNNNKLHLHVRMVSSVGD